MKFSVFVRWPGVASILLLLAAAPPAGAEDLVGLYLRARDFDPVYQTANLAREVAGQVLKQSKAEARPLLTVGVEGVQEAQDISESDNPIFIVNSSNWFTSRFNITLTQPIYRADVYNRIPQARAEVRQAAAEYQAAEQDLIFRLTQAHFNFLAAKDNLDLAVAERTAIGRQLAETEERLGSGLTTITDVHDARSRFALAQAREIDAVDGLEESRQAIAEITGMVPIDLKALSETFPLVEPDSDDVEQWVESALFQNPRVKALQAAIDIAAREVRLQRGMRYPTVDFVALYNYDDIGGSNIGNQRGYMIDTSNISVRVGIPIIDSGRASALTRGAALRQQIAQQDLEREKRRVEREVRAAFQGVLSGIDRVEALVKSVFSNEAAVSAKEQGLRSGLNTGREVLDTRSDLFSARRDLAGARYLYILNSLRLKQAAGILGEHDIRQINAYLQ